MKKNSNTILNMVLLIYILLLIKVILFKYPISVLLNQLKTTDLEMIRIRIIIGNYIPFETISNYWNEFGLAVAKINLIGNVLIFMPLGILLPKRWIQMKFSMVFFVGIATSFLFELIQVLTGFGTADVDDLILNLLGTVIGYFLYQVSLNLNEYFKSKYQSKEKEIQCD